MHQMNLRERASQAQGAHRAEPLREIGHIVFMHRFLRGGAAKVACGKHIRHPRRGRLGGIDKPGRGPRKPRKQGFQ